MWPACKIVHGAVRHSQSQGGVERLNRTVQELFYRFIAHNPGCSWVDDVPFIQFQYNTRTQEGIKKTPYDLWVCFMSR